jgi:hypothetical protein
MRTTWFFISMLALVACTSTPKSDGEYVSPIVADELSEKELKESMAEFQREEEKRIAEEKKNTTSLEFETLSHDFGDVKAFSENTYKFKVKNTGNAPLVIENVSASCGCTTPHKPEKPIPPGGTDYIEVGFKSKEGQMNEIKKTVTVTANTDPKITELQIRAFVK